MYPLQANTKNLHIRPLTEEHIPLWAPFFESEEAIQYFPFIDRNITSLENSKLWIDKQLERYKENRFGLQALINKNTNEFIGQCGLLAQDVNGKQILEIGYSIIPAYWGKGFAYEAACFFKEYVQEHKISSTVYSIIDKQNIKSQRVASKNGMVIKGEELWREMDVFLFGIDL